MPDLRSSRFVRPFTRTGSVFSRLRDQPRTSPNHRHGRSEPEVLASSGLSPQNPPVNEPQWAFADGHRCYPAVPAMPETELRSEAPWSIASTHPSVRPDLGTAGPDDDPGDDEDDDETPTNLTGHHEGTGSGSLYDPFSRASPEDDFHGDDFEELLEGDFLDEDDEDDEEAAERFVVDEWWADDCTPGESASDATPESNPNSEPFDLAQSDDLAPWPIETPDDAIDTFELRRSSTFHSGLVILALDRNRVPFLHVAFRGNPVDDIERALSLFSPSLPNGRIPSGLILGVVRSEHRHAPQSVLDARQLFDEPSIWVDPVESAAWRIAAWKLHDTGIRLHDVLVIEPDRWMSLARAAGLVAYDTVEYA